MREALPEALEGVDRSRWLRIRAVALYAFFAALWILGSDTVLDMVFQDRATLVQMSTYKGWFFVVVTSILLHAALRRPVAPAFAEPARGSIRPWLLPFGAITLVIAGLAAAAISASYRHYHTKEAARLEAIAELRADQIGRWLDERVSHARYVAQGPIAGHFLRWRESGDPVARERLVAALVALQKTSKSRSVMVLDGRGGIFGVKGEMGGAVAPELSAVVSTALARNQAAFTDPVDGTGGAPARFDMAVPLGTNGSQAVVVLRLDPASFLQPTLQRWPLPDHVGRAMLVGLDGRPLLNAKDDAAAFPVARAERGRAFEHTDARGARVMSVAQPVAGTDWLLVTSLAADEIYALGRRDAFWIAAIAAMAVFVYAIGIFLLRERFALQIKAAETREQAHRLHALQLLQAIADSSTDMIYAKDVEGRFILFNREAGRASGMAPEAAIGRHGRDIFPANADLMKATDEKVMETGEPHNYEHELDTVDGKRTYHTTKGLLRGPEGQPTGVFGISRDISGRLRAVQALRDSAELVQAVEDSVLDHMAVLDASGSIVAVNAAWREFGAALDEDDCGTLARSKVGVNYMEDLLRQHSPDALAAREGIASVLSGREPVFTLEYCCGCREPDEDWFVLKVTPLKIARGGAVVVHSGVTELKRSAQEIGRYRDHLEELVAQRTEELEQSNRTLAESERFVRSMTDGMPAALAYWDRDLRCRFANRLFRARFQLGRGAILQMDLREVVGEARFREIEAPVQDALRGWPRQHTTSWENPGAAIDSHYLVNFIPDKVDSKVQGFFLLASEITALRSAQLKLEQANQALVVARDRAESANRAKSAFLANMSHEIRTPINAVIGFTELLKADSSNPDESKRLDQVSEAAQHLLELINDILDLSKIESGKLTLEHATFSLRDAVARAVMLVATQAHAKGLALAVDIARLPDALCGDATRLSQALLNLLGNAVKFTERGRVELRARVLEDSAGSVLLRFEVHDTGIGIASDKIANLFNAFEQADSSTTRRFGGTGLGLALTRHLAQLMGGQAGASSVAGEGSTFWFTARIARAVPMADAALPQAQLPAPASTAAPQSQVQVPAPADAQSWAARVLLVEDNRFNQEVAMAVLKRAGLGVELAVDGQHALAMARAGRYDLVLMDLQMPVMDGFAATRALRRLPQYRETPILALTANAFGETRAACLAAGMNDHIAKPVTPQRLCEILSRWLPHASMQAQLPVQPSGTGLLESLRDIDGFDAAAGLALVGDEDGFVRLLRQFIARHEDGVPGLDGALATGQRDRARRMVHSLKGTSAAIGAGMLQQLATSCEAAIVRGEPIERLRLLAFDIEYELVHLVGALHDRLPALTAEEEAVAPADDMTPAQLEAAVESLGFLLAAGDYGAQRLHRDIAGSLRKAFGEAAGKLAQAVQNHDHERALALIEQLKAGPSPAKT